MLNGIEFTYIPFPQSPKGKRLSIPASAARHSPVSRTMRRRSAFRRRFPDRDSQKSPKGTSTCVAPSGAKFRAAKFPPLISKRDASNRSALRHTNDEDAVVQPLCIHAGAEAQPFSLLVGGLIDDHAALCF